MNTKRIFNFLINLKPQLTVRGDKALGYLIESMTYMINK